MAWHQSIQEHCNRQCLRVHGKLVSSWRFRTMSTVRCFRFSDVAYARHVSSALLHLHRQYFIRAVNAAEGFNVSTAKYAPSVLAVYTSCCNIIWTVYTLYRWEPELSARFSQFWSNCFSAAVSTLVSSANHAQISSGSGLMLIPCRSP